MGHGHQRNAPASEEYHSYVMRVRARPAPAALSIRVEHVNTRKASHFNELDAALDFIARSVRADVLPSSA